MYPKDELMDTKIHHRLDKLHAQNEEQENSVIKVDLLDLSQKMLLHDQQVSILKLFSLGNTQCSAENLKRGLKCQDGYELNGSNTCILCTATKY